MRLLLREVDKPPVPIFNGTFPAPWSLMLPYFLPCTLFAVIMRMEQLSRASRDQAAIDEKAEQEAMVRAAAAGVVHEAS